MRVIYWARLNLARQQITEALAAVPGAELEVVESLQDLLAALPGAEAVVGADAPPDQARQVVAALSNPESTVRWMHFVTAGREGFEAVGLPQNVQISYPAGAVSPTVAEHAMALLLALVRGVPRMFKEQARRNWSREAVSAGVTSIEGRTLAIVGYGQIGREIAKRARAFGMRTVGVARNARPDAFLDEVQPLDDLHSVLTKADVVAVSIALTAETHHLFDRAAFAACKSGTWFINVARGGLVDQVALREALETGHLSGAGLDVTDPEPLSSDDPLWSAPNLIVSPHFAGGGSPASQARLAEGAAANLRRLIAGQQLENIVT